VKIVLLRGKVFHHYSTVICVYCWFVHYYINYFASINKRRGFFSL